MNAALAKFRDRVVDVRADEVRALLLAFVFNFVVLAGYYILRPIREEIGASSGVENLPWMYTATLIGMLIANALFAAIVTRMSRRKFLPIAYRFAISNLFVFFLLMRTVPAEWQWLLARSFFVWVSVFNLFATTLFWAFMTDIFTAEQGKRLFGFIAVGGSLGAILGPLVPTFLVNRFSTGVFCLMSAAMFEIAAQCVRFFPAEFREHQTAPSTAEKPMGGNIWDSV
ncbi:MAG: MFS transporter, partial [Chthoniobacterales bacterium]